MRLGVAVRILGCAGLRARGERRDCQATNPSINLLWLREVLLYPARHQIRCYRLPDDLLGGKRATGAQLADLHEHSELLNELAGLIQQSQQRLTIHLGMGVVLSSPDENIVTKSIAEIVTQAQLLDLLNVGPEGVLVLHTGGVYGDRLAALHRFATRMEQLPNNARARVVVELDQSCFSLPDLLRLHQMIGVPIVLDTLHLQMNNPERIPLGEALGLALATWPLGMRPKVHFSSQRTEAHLLPGRRGDPPRVLAPRHGQHADFINPFDFAAFIATARGLPRFDIMLEAKGADLALLRLREDLRQFTPEVVGILK